MKKYLIHLVTIVLILSMNACVSKKIREKKIQKCEAGSAAHCLDAAHRVKSVDDQVKYYERACKLGNETGCSAAKVLKADQKAKAKAEAEEAKKATKE